MRRRLAVLSTIVLGLLLTAGPALATEGSGGSGGSSGDDDLWTGLILALFGGVIIGIVAFVDSTTGRNALDDAEHDAAH